MKLSLSISLQLPQFDLGREKVIDSLVKNGANIDRADNRRKTALHYAAENGKK